MVERRIVKRQGAGITDPKLYARILVLSPGVLDIGRGQVEASHARYVRVLAEAKIQVAGAAPQIQNAFRGGDPGEFDESGCS